MIYNFYYHYNPKAKPQIIRFLASYLQVYEKALDSQKEMDNMSKNLRRNRPTEFNIKIEDYLPERFRPI